MNTLEHQLMTASAAFKTCFHKSPLFVAYAPGRINIIGEHTDYNQGLSMPCAINRWVTVSVFPNIDQHVEIVSTDFNGRMVFNLGEVYVPTSSWEEYVYGCIELFRANTNVPFGFQALISGNVPIGAGVSSSAALEVAMMNALNYLTEHTMNGLELVKLCQQVEHQYLQVKSGLLDQYASQFSKAGQCMALDFDTLTHLYIDVLDQNFVWVLCDTKVKRSLAGTKYSERVLETQNGFSALQEHFSTLMKMRDIEEKHLSTLENVFLQKRLRHYVTENSRVEKALEALHVNDMETFGNLITASHLSLRDDYEVSCEELDFLVEEAIATNYCLGSRMMGGGFGGCTINLVKADHVDSFAKKIRDAYFLKFGIETEINVYQSVDGAGVFPVLKNVHDRA